jgi:predicted lipid-binding transport protein (Tim44 family)
MGEGFQFLDIILFAMIAAFLVFRLRGVLGRRTGHQRRPPDMVSRRRQESANNDNVVDLPDRGAGADDESFETEADDDDDPIAAGLAKIRAADGSFDAEEFMAGTRAAFEMILQAFVDGDTKTLRSLLNDEVFENFSAAIEEREQASETLEKSVIGIKSTDLLEARMSGRTAFVTIKFVSEQVNVTRDKDGEAIDGDPNHVANVTDIWTFARNTRARDPNWTLVETRSPN